MLEIFSGDDVLRIPFHVEPECVLETRRKPATAMNNALIPKHSTAPATQPSQTAMVANQQDWLRLNQLPGFMWSAIRALGESAFAPLTRTPLAHIEVIANLSGQGPHTQQMIDATASALRQQSEPSNILEYTSEQMRQFFGALYQAQAVQFEEITHTYLLVKDALGSYIYRWPAADTNRRIGSLEKKSAVLIEK